MYKISLVSHFLAYSQEKLAINDESSPNFSFNISNFLIKTSTGYNELVIHENN